MTRAEADVYNEINQRHLSRKLGMEMFTIKERMVKETEVHNLRTFLDFSEKRVANKGPVISSGKVRLNVLLLYFYMIFCCRRWLAS